jgi:DNA-binding XRE family transcriptional regulator
LRRLGGFQHIDCRQGSKRRNKAIAPYGLRDVSARNMRKLRAAHGLTQEALAYDRGVDPGYVSSIERAKRNMSIDNIGADCKGARGRAMDAAEGWLST